MSRHAPTSPTKRHIALLKFIARYKNRFVWCPSLREMADELKTSTSVVNYYLDYLHALKYVSAMKRKGRTNKTGRASFQPRTVYVTKRGTQYLNKIPA